MSDGRVATRSARLSSRQRMCAWCAVAVAYWIAAAGAVWGQEAGQVRRLIRDGQLDSALAVVDAAIARDSLRAPLWNLRDEICRLRTDDAGRIATLSAALRLRPNDDDLRLNLIEALIDVGAADSAASMLELAYRYAQQPDARGHYLTGRIHEARGQLDSALVSYRRAWELVSEERLF